MTDYAIGIPSYKRADKQKTIAYLDGIGIDTRKVILSVQTADDFEKYGYLRENIGELIYREGRNNATNRNTIMNRLKRGDRLIMLDDDISMIHKLKDGDFENIDTKEKFERLVRTGFALCAKFRTRGFGLYNVDNAYFLKNTYSEKAVSIGTFLGIIVGDERFDESMDTKVDFDFCCQMIQKTGRFIRLNNYSTKADHFNKDGCGEQRKDGVKYIKDAQTLVNKYPSLLKMNAKKRGEVVFKHGK